MKTKTERDGPSVKAQNSNQPPRRLFPWRQRATFQIANNAKQRRRQMKTQLKMLIITLTAVLISVSALIYFNWREAGSAKSVSCRYFPQYCVPLVGGAAGDDARIERNETVETRQLDAATTAAANVVRGFRDNMPFLGKPDAPIHFVVASDYACPHCQNFHRSNLKQFLEEYVLTGQATVQFALLTGTGGVHSEIASQAALCAGEQGVLWEVSDEMFRLAEAYGPANGFSPSRIRTSANNMGLDSSELVECIASGRYTNFLTHYQTFSYDHGVTGTPTILVSYGETGDWSIVRNAHIDYNVLRTLTEAANSAQTRR